MKNDEEENWEEYFQPVYLRFHCLDGGINTDCHFYKEDRGLGVCDFVVERDDDDIPGCSSREAVIFEIGEHIKETEIVQRLMQRVEALEKAVLDGTTRKE